MSDNNNNIETETVNPITPAKKGQKRRTADELRSAFAECKTIIGADNLVLQIDEKSRCTVVSVSGDEAEIVLGPLAGNTFMHYLKGAQALAPFAG